MAIEPLWITEKDVVEAIDLRVGIDAVRGILRAQATQRAATMEKTQLLWGDGHTLHALGGVCEEYGLAGTKTWAHTGGSAAPFLLLWDTASGELRAVIEAFALGQLRTAAMTGVATELLAPTQNSAAALIGTGKQALPQLAAMLVAREPTEVRVFSPTQERRQTFVAAARAVAKNTDIIECATVESAVRGATLITTVTRSREPFLQAEMLAPHAHVNAVGAIGPERAEIAPDVYEQATAVVTDSIDAVRGLAAEVPTTIELTPLSAVADRGASAVDGVTVFKAMGIGLADLALGHTVLDYMQTRSRGLPLPTRQKAHPRLFGGTE